MEYEKLEILLVCGGVHRVGCDVHGWRMHSEILMAALREYTKGQWTLKMSWPKGSCPHLEKLVKDFPGYAETALTLDRIIENEKRSFTMIQKFLDKKPIGGVKSPHEGKHTNDTAQAVDAVGNAPSMECDATDRDSHEEEL